MKYAIQPALGVDGFGYMFLLFRFDPCRVGPFEYFYPANSNWSTILLYR
jgi:hypothetical protein